MSSSDETMHFEVELGLDGNALLRGREANYVLVRRPAFRSVDLDWVQREGAYILLGPESSHSRRVYVGKSDSGSRGRLDTHARSRDWWTYAIVLTNNRDMPFTRDQVAELERQLYGMMQSRSDVCLENLQAPTGSRSRRDARSTAAIIEELNGVLSLVANLVHGFDDPENDGPWTDPPRGTRTYVRGQGPGARQGGPQAVVLNGRRVPLPQHTWRNAWRVVVDHALDHHETDAREWLLGWHDGRERAEPLALLVDQAWTKQGQTYVTHGLTVGAQFSAARIQRLITELAAGVGFEVAVETELV